MSAQDTLIQKYGPPDTVYQRNHCRVWYPKKEFPWFPAEKIMINSDFCNMLVIALKSVETKGLQHEIEFFDGCYSYRKSRTTAKLSLHSWAAAIDLNAAKEVLGQRTTRWSAAFINCFTDAGIFWGGNFHGTKDPMHFAMLDG